MEYIIMWLGTFVASTGMKSAVAIKLIKDIADCGYKMNINRLQEISSFINPVNVKLQKIINIIPVCNLFFALYIVVGISNQRERIIDAMKTMGAIEYMSDEEQEEYNKNKSLLNAVRIMNESMEKKNIEDKNEVVK